MVQPHRVRIQMGGRRAADVLRVCGAVLILTFVAVLCFEVPTATDLVGDPVGVFGALGPFTSASLVIGLGSVAVHLMLVLAWTGVVGARVTSVPPPHLRRWPETGHLCWLVALRHGLSPRPPPERDVDTDPSLPRGAARPAFAACLTAPEPEPQS